eukprot:jgi/Mesen1/8429/ME000473S07776
MAETGCPRLKMSDNSVGGLPAGGVPPVAGEGMVGEEEESRIWEVKGEEGKEGLTILSVKRSRKICAPESASTTDSSTVADWPDSNDGASKLKLPAYACRASVSISWKMVFDEHHKEVRLDDCVEHYVRAVARKGEDERREEAIFYIFAPYLPPGEGLWWEIEHLSKKRTIFDFEPKLDFNVVLGS